MILARESPDHYAVDLSQMLLHFLSRANATVDHNGQVRKFAFKCPYTLVVQGWNRAVLFRAQPRQHGDPRMHIKRLAAGIRNSPNEFRQSLFRILPIHTNTAFHRNWNVSFCLHFRHAIRDPERFFHQTGSETSCRNAAAWATNIQIYLIVAKTLGDSGTVGQVIRITATKLERDWLFGRIKSKQRFGISM